MSGQVAGASNTPCLRMNVGRTQTSRRTGLELPKKEDISMISRTVQVLLMGLLVCGTGISQNYAETRKTLTGVQEVEVVVHGLSGDLAARGVTVQFVKGEVEAKLRESGIQILSKARSPGFPILAVLVNSIKVSGETTFYAASIRVELRQTATLTRDRAVESHNVTWSSSSMIAARAAVW